MTIAAYYGILPASVRYHSLLKPIEKLVYCELTALLGSGGYTIVCLEQLQAFAGCSENTVKQYLGNLEKCGFIKQYPQEDNRIKIYLRNNAKS